MKKLITKMIFVIVLCLTMSGCGTENQANKKIDNNGIENNGDMDSEEIKKPVIDWWKVYKNLNKTNCVVLQVSNPNNFPIQFRYDLVYYKNNEVVKTEKNWAMTGIDSLKSGLIYGDIKIPSSDAVDKVELENIEVSKFEWKVLKGTFKKSFIDNGVQYFDVKFPENPDHTEIWAVLYNDVNGDKKIQANEFVEMGLLAPFVGIYKTEGEIKIPTPDERYVYTDYEIYSFAFVRENSN